MSKPTPQTKLANRRRMAALGLSVERIPPHERQGYIRGNLAVHVALERVNGRKAK